MTTHSADFFSPENAAMLDFQLSQNAIDYSASLEGCERYWRQQDPAMREGMLRELEQHPEVHEQITGIKNILGDMLGGKLVSDIVMSDVQMMGGKPHITDEEFQELNDNLVASMTELLTLTGALAEYAVAQSRNGGFFDTDDEAEQVAWSGVWGRLIKVIRPIGGVVLADVANLFDNLVRYKYHATYDPMDNHRGSEAREDVATRTFYEQFAPHLSRAITRRGEDNWSS